MIKFLNDTDNKIYFLIPASHPVLVMVMYRVNIVHNFLLCFCFNLNRYGGYGNMHYCENFKAHKKMLSFIRPLLCYIQTLVAIYEKIIEVPLKV